MDKTRGRTNLPRAMAEDNEEFDEFMDALTNMLHSVNLRDLATSLKFPKVTLLALKTADDPYKLMVKYMEERNIITPSDISPLAKALQDLHLDDTRKQVLSSFRCDDAPHSSGKRHYAQSDHEFESKERKGALKDETTQKKTQPTATPTTTETKFEVHEKWDDTRGNIKGFGRFIVDVASFFTLAIALQLATVYSFSNADVDRVSMHVDHGWMLLEILKQKGEISPTDISSLTDALGHIGLHGIVATVEDSFKRNVSVYLSSSADYLASDGDIRRGIKGKKERFIKDIKESYAEMYNGVQPIPYIRERLLCVNRVFIDSGMEYVNKEGGSNDGSGTWLKLGSYNSIFTDPRLSNAMVFLLYGEPGYGKSTLALQYVYDWCNRSSGSPLKDVEMLIFLRLRYLKVGMNFFKAIKQFLLPRDTTLNARDIEDIILNCRSVVLVFDGFDEYSHPGDSREDDVTQIITRQAFRHFKVILTTRPSSTPPKLSYVTQKVRLTGFDDKAKERYILKAVVDRNAEAAANIMQRLQQNPILADICQVPLFFVMFAHMTHGEAILPVLDSVTSFFRYVMACFYEHIQIRAGRVGAAMKGESARKHHKLDKVAFESLQGKDQHLVWSRDRLVELIDEPLYNELVEIGILVEENVLRIVDEPGTSAADLFQRRKNVSFYHKLFCEWYAAHYVAEYVNSLETIRLQRFFANMDPFDLQYVYRIACGLNPVAADRIIQYLHSLEGGDKFAILCILEQTGKVDKIKDTIRQMCFEGVIISGYDSLLLQRSSMQLLEIAARHEITMDFEYQHVLLASLLAAYSCVGLCSVATCESPQYMNYGKIGTVNCTFHDDFFSVLWFDTKYYRKSEPILHYQDFTPSGAGYNSGEFDIHPNGSLIINNVTLAHETTFTALYVHSQSGGVVILQILVAVIVKPAEPYPLITYCANGVTCFAEVVSASVNCSVGSARPSITLTWVARTVNGDRNITTDMSITSEGLGYTSRTSTANIFADSSLLVLLVCKASGLPGVLQNKESVLLAQNKNINILSTEKRSVYIERYTKLKLDCTVGNLGFVVWKKVCHDDTNDKAEHETLLYSIFLGGDWTEVFVSGVQLGTNASLVVPVVDVRHEGLYYCIYGDGLTDGLIVYDVTVKVVPVPSYPVVEGCNHQQYCVLESNYEGILTCKLKGIRPQVQLKWNTFLESDASWISFTNQHLTVTERGEIFDVTLTSTYHVLDMSRDRLTIECKVPESSKKLFHLRTKLDLMFEEDNVEASPAPMSNKLIWILPITVVLLLLLFILCLGVIYRKHGKDKPIKFQVAPKDPEEVSVMLSSVDLKHQTLTEQFLRQIKEKYKDLYDAVQPIPYIKDRLYCVDKVFVEGGVEFSDSSGGRIAEWKRLETYQDIFHDPRVKSTRRILEGEPGYGKSTITLQFAYDWCNDIQGSALNDVELLILLRLRQLSGVSSIYRAIKQFILPKDSTLTETDIENILRNSTSVVVILDGFDEYPDQESKPSTDVINIIARQMFQEYDVVTTTRSSFLPKKYPPLTKRVKLSGFDDNSRRFYIRKAVVGEDEERVREIEQYLEENPILHDLCQVPLLFVIFAHMTYESEQFRNLNSVTSFFRYMISCFHSHMRNKMEDENVCKYELFETDHRNLDRVAFDAFSGNTQKIVWEKEVLCEQIDQEFYDQYVRIGILIEEEVIDISDGPGTLINEHVQYKTEVRFYHKLFCEWYAAHYLADYLQHNPNVDLNAFLQHLDPFDVQYLYRFSCGLDSDSAEKIISYLKNIEGGDKFAILCILEQTGKVDHIKETIRELCFEGVIISAYDSLLLQRSSMQLLELAARNDIPIEYVRLSNCLQLVDLSTSAIRTTSGLALTSKIPVKVLQVSLYNRDMTKDEAIDILQFASMCPSLRELQYGDCVPPRSFSVGPILSTLKTRNVKVLWQWAKDKPEYILNLQSGRWKNREDGSEPAEEDLKRALSKIAEWRTGRTEETYRTDVKKGREIRRKRAEERQSNPR